LSEHEVFSTTPPAYSYILELLQKTLIHASMPPCHAIPGVAYLALDSSEKISLLPIISK